MLYRDWISRMWTDRRFLQMDWPVVLYPPEEDEEKTVRFTNQK